MEGISLLAIHAHSIASYLKVIDHCIVRSHDSCVRICVCCLAVVVCALAAVGGVTGGLFT